MENELRKKQVQKNNVIFGLSMITGAYLLALVVTSIINLVNMFGKKVPLPQYPGLNFYVAFLNIILGIITIYLIAKMARYHLKGEYIWGISPFFNTLILSVVNFGSVSYLYNFSAMGGKTLQLVMIAIAIIGIIVSLIRIKVVSKKAAYSNEAK